MGGEVVETPKPMALAAEGIKTGGTLSAAFEGWKKERTPSPNTLTEYSRAIALFKELHGDMEAVPTLRKWSQAIKQTENFIAPGSNYFIIQFQNFRNLERSVEVKGFTKFQEDYETIEPGGTKILKTTTVLVEVDKVENLREAYPNYFLDMTLFAQNLTRVIEGSPLLTHLQAEPDAGKAAVRGVNAHDLTFLEAWRRRSDHDYPSEWVPARSAR